MGITFGRICERDAVQTPEKEKGRKFRHTPEILPKILFILAILTSYILQKWVILLIEL